MTVLRRLLGALVLLLVVSVLVFALIHAAPGGPLTLYLENPNVRPEDIVRLKKALGLDRSLAEQYVAWLHGFVVGEWGYSFSDGRPASGQRDDEAIADEASDRAREPGHRRGEGPVVS